MISFFEIACAVVGLSIIYQVAINPCLHKLPCTRKLMQKLGLPKTPPDTLPEIFDNNLHRKRPPQPREKPIPELKSKMRHTDNKP